MFHVKAEDSRESPVYLINYENLYMNVLCYSCDWCFKG